MSDDIKPSRRHRKRGCRDADRPRWRLPVDTEKADAAYETGAAVPVRPVTVMPVDAGFHLPRHRPFGFDVRARLDLLRS